MDAYRRQRWTVNGVLSNAKSNLGSSKPFHDRFIVPMDALDVEVARHLLHEDNKEDESPTKKAYGKVLASCLFNDAGISTRRGRIMNHHTKRKAPPKLKDLEPGVLCEVAVDAKLKGFGRTKRYIPQTADRTLDAPDILDDYYLNLLDWSSTNIVSIALGDTAYMWNATMKTSYELFSVDEDVGPITSVNWAPNGIHLAAGMNNSVIQLWDHDKQIQLRNLNGHTGRVGALSWNGNIVTAGSLDGKILSHDVRVRDSIVQMFRGHREEVCGLKWSLTGKLLASGGNDNLLHIWEKRMASSSSTITTPYLHRFTEHRAAVKAQAWCPFQNHVLASGGGSADRCIKLWNVNSGQCLNSIDTNSQVCALLWNKHEKELLSSHGYADNQLTLWKYPSMTKITELSGHSARVLHMAQSPDGCTVASAGADETLRFWQIFRDPVTEKKKRTTEDPPFRKTGRIFLR